VLWEEILKRDMQIEVVGRPVRVYSNSHPGVGCDGTASAIRSDRAANGSGRAAAAEGRSLCQVG